MISLVELKAQFADAMRAHGVEPPQEIIADGCIHRFRVNGERVGKKSGAYRLFADSWPAGWFQNHKNGGPIRWRAQSKQRLSPEEREARRAKIREDKIKHEAEEAERHARAAEIAAAIWKHAQHADEHPYLAPKRVEVHGLRAIEATEARRFYEHLQLNGLLLVVPMRDSNHALHSIQFIDSDGNKHNLKDGAKKGHYHAIGKPSGTLCIVEGYADGASIYEATGNAVAIAIDAYNLKAVALALRSKFPDARIIICADNDIKPDQPNTGVEEAIKAALAVEGLIAIPELNGKKCDFNDLHRERGANAVSAAIAKTTSPKSAGPSNTQSPSWDDPILFDEIETPEIPARLLPGEFGEFARAVATATETPEALAVMTVLGTASGAIAKRFYVSPKEGWREPVNTYALVALPPGNAKTHVFNACTFPLGEWEREQKAMLEPEIRRQRSKRKSEEKIIESKRCGLGREKDSEKRKALMNEIAEMEANLAEPEVLPELFTNDSTPEQLAISAYEQGGRYAIFSDEGGITETLSGLYSNGAANVDILLKGSDGGEVRVRRKDRRIDVNSFLTIVLTVQPIILTRISEKKAFAGKGLLERFLWALPKSKLGFRTHDKAPVSDACRLAYRNAIRKLLHIPPLLVNGIEQPRVLTLARDAHSDWRDFQAEVEKQLRPDGRLAICQGWGAKIAGYALRIAGQMHVMEHGQDNLNISANTMGRALELSALLSEHAIAACTFMGTDAATEDAKDCWRWIAALRSTSFVKRDLTYAMRHKMNADRIEKALKVLMNRDLISEAKREPGKKTIRYAVNPNCTANR